MSGLRDIKLRIKSIDNIRQITKAMNLIATVRLKKAREKAESSIAFKEEASAMLSDISRHQDLDSRYFQTRETNNSLYIVISSDRGLCGSYNAAIIKKAVSLMENKNVKIITIGGKSRDYFKRNDYEVIESYSNILERASIKDAEMILEKILEMYLSGAVDEVFLVYTEFVSSVQYIPSSIKLLPLDMKKDSKGRKNYEFEPSMERFMDAFIFKYLSSNIFFGFTNSLASEYSSKMMAMSSATENATKIIDELTLSYNRARQATITNEISEIVGGTEALK